jgi:hypothetical protein
MHTIRLDVTAALAWPCTCPSCAAELAAVVDEDGVSFACAGCDMTWTPELGALVPQGPGRSGTVGEAPGP